MPGYLSDILREIGIITVPSRKGEINFVGDDNADELHVVYSEHRPDGAYTDATIWTFRLAES